MADGVFNLLVLAAPVVAVGLVLIGLGARNLARQVPPGPGPWWTRVWSRQVWWSVHALSPGIGLVMIATGALFAVGLLSVGLGVLLTTGAAGLLVALAHAVRIARAGRIRDAVLYATVLLVLLTSLVGWALGFEAGSDVLLALAMAGLIVLPSIELVRRWRAADRARRRQLAQPVALGIGLITQPVARLLPDDQQGLSWTLTILGLVSMIVACVLLFGARWQRTH